VARDPGHDLHGGFRAARLCRIRIRTLGGDLRRAAEQREKAFRIRDDVGMTRPPRSRDGPLGAVGIYPRDLTMHRAWLSPANRPGWSDSTRRCSRKTGLFFVEQSWNQNMGTGWIHVRSGIPLCGRRLGTRRSLPRRGALGSEATTFREGGFFFMAMLIAARCAPTDTSEIGTIRQESTAGWPREDRRRSWGGRWGGARFERVRGRQACGWRKGRLFPKAEEGFCDYDQSEFRPGKRGRACRNRNECASCERLFTESRRLRASFEAGPANGGDLDAP